MQNTNFVPGQSIFSNGQITGNSWGTPGNIFLNDQQYATSDVNTGSASDFIIGNFNLNLPQDAVPTGIEIEIIGHRGAQTIPPISLDVSIYDDTNGASNFYPYTAPITSLTTNDSSIVIGGSTYMFATSFTVDQINNLKVALTANGDISLDDVLVKVYYFIQTPPAPPVIVPGVCVDCSSPIQVQAMYLELPFLIGETKFYLKKGSFSYPNGISVQPGDVGSCGGTIPFVFDESKRKMDGQNFEENAMLDTNNGGTWIVLPSGVIEVDLGFVTQRGLDFKTPAAHIASNMSDHDANSKVIISNNEPYNLTLLRTCQVNTVFSPPIYVKDENAYLPTNLHDLDFRGAGVSAINDGVDPFHKIITIPGVGGTTPPVVVSVISATSGNVQVLTLSANLQVSGINRGVVIQVSTEEVTTITSITVGGVAATQEAVSTDVGTNLRSETWFCQNPPLGSQPVVVTVAPAAYITFGAECVNGVDPVAPVGNTQTATATSLNPTLLLITGTDYSIVIDGLATAQTPILYTPGAGQANNWNIVANTSTRQGGSSVENAGLQPDNITMDYAITQNTVWCYTAIEVKGITTAVPGSGQTAIQFQDEGVNLGVAGTVDTLDFVGAGVSAARVGNVVTVTIPGGAGTDELVSVSAADTTPGYLNPKLNVHSSDGSVIVTPTITNPGGNEILDIDLTGAGGGGSDGGGMSAADVTLFDDFVSAYVGNDTGSPAVFKSGNFGGQDPVFVLAELDHPGIARMDTSGDVMYGFTEFDENGFPTAAENLTYDNDFDITFLCRLTYNGTFTAQWQLSGTTDDITLEIDETTVSYDIGAGVVATAVPPPLTTVWFQPRFVYASGILTIYIDSSVVFTGAVALADSFKIVQNVIAIGGGNTLDFDTDYVVTKYETDRTSPTWGGGGSEKKVGVGETDDITWFNIQYPIMKPIATNSDYSMWDTNNLASISNFGIAQVSTNDYLSDNSTDYSGLLPWFDTPDVLKFNSGKQAIFQLIVFTDADNANQNLGGVGFNIWGSASIKGNQGTNTTSVGFVRKDSDGTWYARAADGAAFTETLITISANAKHVLRCEYDPGNAIPQARYYVDGILAATITTDLPTAVNSVIGFCAGNGGGASDRALTHISAPSFAVEI